MWRKRSVFLFIFNNCYSCNACTILSELRPVFHMHSFTCTLSGALPHVRSLTCKMSVNVNPFKMAKL